jgi:hypothetical protein
MFMRTSIDIPDRLLGKAKTIAHRRGTTFRQIVIEALQAAVEERRPERPFRLRDASFGEGGLVEGLSESDWDRVRDLAYEGRRG